MAPQHRWIWLIYFTLLWIVQIATKEVRVVCYYTNWSVYRPGSAKFSPQNINPYLCTHLIYAFGGFTKENTLKPFDKYQDIEKGGYAKFTGLKTYNKNLKTMLAIGGWNEGSSRFSPMVANAERRKELVKNVVKFLRQNHFDGLDLDWEYPSFRDGGKTRDRDNYAQLVQELREEFERESGKTRRTRLLLTMAVPAGIEYINKGYDVPKLMKYLDWMNILSYDYHSAFEPSVNHHAPLYPLEEDNEYNYDTDLNIDHTIKHYLEAGAISTKLVLGIPTYGRSYTLFNPDANEIGAPADGPGEMGDATRENGYLAYYEICEGVKGGEWEVVQPNENAMGPYAFKDNQWVGYDDENIARKKSQYVAEHNLGGIMFWAIDNDDFRGSCHNKSYPIIEAAKEALVEALGLTDENVISKPTKATKTRGRPRTTVKTTETPAVKERTQNSGGRQSSDKPSSRRRIVNRVRNNNKNSVQSSNNVNKGKRRRRPTTKSTPIREEPIFKESGSSLVVTTPSYKTPEPPTTPDPGGDFKCEDEGFYPHPRDCKKYFWCLSGPSELGIIAHQFTCPAGLYFNKAAASCDYTQNVLCNKKRNTTPKPTTTVSTTEAPKPETTKKAEIFNFSTKRPAAKITAATSRTTFYSTTEAPEYYDEYEYEDDVDDEDEDNSPDINDSEDPLVIKELLELIKKAGGIEELEKQLHLKSDPTQSEGSTTQSSLSKKLYERVLAKTKLNDSLNTRKNSFKYNSINRNSRGPQIEAGNTEQGDAKVEKTRTRGSRPQYSTITRQRASKVSDEKDAGDEEDEGEEEEIDNVKEEKQKEKEVSSGGKKYITLRRNRPTTTAEPDIEESLTKLGESRGTTSTSRSPYVTLRRSRPTTAFTTEESTTTEGKSSRRRPPVESNNDEDDSSSPNYVVIQRTRPTSTEGSTANYKEIVRGTTAIPGVSEDVENETETFQEVSTHDTNSITNASDDITNPIVTNINEDTTARVSPSQNTEKQSADLSTTQNLDIKPPKLSEPRPFSFNTNVRSSTVKTTTTEKVTPSSKVSHKPLLRSRPVEAPDSNQHLDVNNNDQNNKVDTVYTRTRSRGSSRFRVPEITTERIYSQGGGGGGSYEEYERHYRPDLSAHISDLSSLTAVDFSLKGITGSSRRLRPRITPAATKSTASTPSISTTTEKIEEASKTVARKFLESSSFGNRRRSTISTTISTTPVSSQTSRRTFAPFRKGFTTASTAEDDDDKRLVDIKAEANGPLVKFKRPSVAKQGADENGSAIKFRRLIFPKTTTANVTNEETDSSEKIRPPVFNKKSENEDGEDVSTTTTIRPLTSKNSGYKDISLTTVESEANTTSEAPLKETTRAIVDSENDTDEKLVKGETFEDNEDENLLKSTDLTFVPDSTRSSEDIKSPRPEDSDDTSNETDVEVTTSKVKIRRPSTEEPAVTKLNRKVIKRIRVTTPSTTTIHEDTSSQIIVPIVNPELNNVHQTPIPYARRMGPVTENAAENVVNSTEDDAEDELDEDENIKLSESNILENSDLNRANTNAINDGGKKGHRKVIKRIKFTTTPSDVTQDNSTTSTTENGIVRTRKVIRKLTSGTTEASDVEDNKRKKIIRRLRPKTEDSEESEEQEEFSKEISRPKFTTTTESLKNRIKPFRPNKKLPIKESAEKVLNKQLPRRLKLFTRRPPTTTERVVTSSTVDPLSIADIIKLNTSNETSEGILGEKRLEVKTLNEENTDEEKIRRLEIYTRISTTEESFNTTVPVNGYTRISPAEFNNDELLISENSTDEMLTTEATTVGTNVDDSFKSNDSNLPSKRLKVYTRPSLPIDEFANEEVLLSENSTDESPTTEGTTVGTNEDSTLPVKRLKIYTRPSPVDAFKNDDENSTDESSRLYTKSTTEGTTVRINEDGSLNSSEDKGEDDVKSDENNSERTLSAKRLKLYTRPSSVENVGTTKSDELTENPLLPKRFKTLQSKPDDVNSNATEESILAKRLKLYTRPPITYEITEDPLLSKRLNSSTNDDITEDSLLVKKLTEQVSTDSPTTKSDEIIEDPLLAKRLKLYTRTTTQKPSTEATIEEFVNTESNTEDSTETSTEEILETTIMNNSDTTEDSEEVTTEIPDETTTEYDSTETTEVTTLEPKPSTPVYVNKIYKTAGARPKLDLKSRLGLKYTTATPVRSTQKPSTKFEARSRRPPRFRSSTTEATRIEEPDNDDVGYGTVKPFKKLFVSTDRPRFRINNDGIRVNNDAEDYEEYEDEKEIKPVISSTTGKYYVNTDSFNRSQYSKPTESVEVLNDEDDDDEEDEDEDFPDSDEKEYDDEDVEIISRKPYVVTSSKPFASTTDKVSFVTSNIPARTRKVNNPYDSSTKRTKTSTRAYRRFTSTTPQTTTQNLTDINIEALNQRNKQLFNKTRKMNTPHPGPVSVELNVTVSDLDNNLEANATVATETTTDSDMYSTDANMVETTVSEVDFETTVVTDETTTTNVEPPTVPPTIRTTTTEKPTTFYHIFAETESTQSTPTLEETTTEAKKDMVERIIEVNRIVHINGENNTLEMNPVLDHIGVVNRVTSINVVEGNNGTNVTNHEQQKIAISINGPNILTEILGASREERKFEIYGDSKVSNSLHQQYSDVINAKNSESAPNQIVIDSKSVVKTITPKPLFSNEVSTIALEGLFMTQSTLKPEQPSTTEYEELLETENSHFVNVKVLHGSPKNAVFIVRPEEDVTMKADVVEISRPITAGLIKIAPISVSFQKKIPNIK